MQAQSILLLFAEHTFKARLEFVGRLVRKGYCKDAHGSTGSSAARRRALSPLSSEDLKLLLVSILRYLVTVSGSAVTQKIRNAVYEHGGLPAARPREYQQRPQSLKRPPPHGVQVLEITAHNSFARFYVVFFQNQSSCVRFYHKRTTIQWVK